MPYIIDYSNVKVDHTTSSPFKVTDIDKNVYFDRSEEIKDNLPSASTSSIVYNVYNTSKIF